MPIEKPTIFSNLLEWRERNGFTTPEWEMYIDARNGQWILTLIIFSMASWILGFSMGGS